MGLYNPKEIEKEIADFWQKAQIPQKIVKLNPKKPKFYLLDGPPYVNHIPHVGHIKTTTFKDVWGKFKTMSGFSVWWQPGFDCSGLPIENAVEKQLGVSSKKDIVRKIGVAKFIAECRKLAEKNLHIWMDLYKKLGAWKGWLEPYLTYKNYYIESGWWTVKKLWDAGLLVEGQKPGYWCPRCGTVLAGYEVSDSYKIVEDPSIFVKFKLKERPENLLVWTTTPWTLPANVAIAVHPDEKYVKAVVGNDLLIIAKKRLPVLKELGFSYKVEDEFTGKKMEGLKYEPILDIPLQKALERDKNSHQVICSIPIIKKRVASKLAIKKIEEEEFGHVVDMESGSGLVHIAPGHGDADNRLGKHYNLPEPSPVDDSGKLTKDAGQFAGLFVKAADVQIIHTLEKEGKLLWSGKIAHSYPLCWRCKTPLIYRMSRQWFLKIDTLKSGMLAENKKVKWLPDFASEQFANVLTDAPDWAITRQRFWGIPIPIWCCSKCGAKKVIGSVAELRKAATKTLKNIDLHKDFVDNVKLKCECGGKMDRIPDIMDVWFDSGIAPWASLGWPFKNKNLFKKLWPVDLVDESQDQIRGWFYTLMFCGFSIFKQSPYKTVCLNGWTLDDKGEKMSKSLGNVIWAADAWQKLGADILRLYYCWDVPPWETQKFSFRKIEDLRRALNVVWNTYEFIQLYAKTKAEMKNLTKEDIWLLSKINSLISSVTSDIEQFKFHSASRAIIDFCLNDLSRFYVKLVRDRVSPWYSGPDKESAQAVLIYVFERLTLLLAPFTPFLAEKFWQGLGKVSSVHMEAWPKCDKKFVNKEIENDMEIAKAVIEAGIAARQASGIKLRWPIDYIWFEPKNSNIANCILRTTEIVKAMVNAKELRIVGRAKEPTIIPKNLKWYNFEIGKIAIGQPLKEEAIFREIIRYIQILRKNQGLKVDQPIALWLLSNESMQKLLKAKKENLMIEVGAKEVTIGQIKSKKGQIEIEGIKIEIGFECA
jgi:isoleucyl-tRNA synthetase